MILCRDCRRPYPSQEIPHRCLQCGGMYDYQREPRFFPGEIKPDLPGIWRYRHTFSLAEKAPAVSLGEGQTPLIWAPVEGKQVGFKLEFTNPTGSFKDRGTAVLVSFLISRGVDRAVEDSSGNAGASLAAYAASQDIQAEVYVPAYASGPKREQIDRYGARVHEVPGPRSRAAEEVVQAAQGGAVYASHAYLPHGLRGMATIAYELWEELGVAPGSILLPVGHGSLLLGVDQGFRALRQAGLISGLPRLIGVQSGACAPLAEAFQRGLDQPLPVEERETLAEGIRIAVPYRGPEVLTAVRESAGQLLMAGEREIRTGREQLSRLGFDVELTSGVVWDAARRVLGQVPDPVVVILTGHGLKDAC